MKRSLGALIAFSAISVGAQAADLPSHKSSPPPYLIAPPPLWTGFYVGANLGGGVPNRGAGGVIGGGQLGYNYQFSRLFVAGLETDIQGSSMSGVHWFGTVRGRLGTTVVNPTLLVYGTGDLPMAEAAARGQAGPPAAALNGLSLRNGPRMLNTSMSALQSSDRDVELSLALATRASTSCERD